RYESYIIHYAHMPEEQIMAPLVKDARAIDAIPDDFESLKYIWIHADGGLGDQIQAEPAIRFALEHVWPTADIRVSTIYPELFAHLPIRCGTSRSEIWDGVDTEPFFRETLPGPES